MREFVIFLFLSVLVELVGLAEASQQCRLISQLQGHDQIPISGPIPTSTPPSATPTPSSIYNVSTPSPTPFKYGTNTIRGVNLYVIIAY